MSEQSLIHAILKKKSIVEYLEKRGHQPYKSLSGGKLQYLCPFPDHKENKPSFVVWTNDEFEKFYCFGCQRNYNIINLVAGLEGISFRDAVEILGDGMEIGVHESIEIELERISKNMGNIDRDMGMPETLLSISNLCRSYLDGVKNDPDEQCLIDKLFSIVDGDVREFKFDEISQTLSNLPFVLYKKQQKFYQKKYNHVPEDK